MGNSNQANGVERTSLLQEPKYNTINQTGTPTSDEVDALALFGTRASLIERNTFK